MSFSHCFAWKRLFSCKPHKAEVHDPSTDRSSTRSILLQEGTPKRTRCSWSYSFLKAVVGKRAKVKHNHHHVVSTSSACSISLRSKASSRGDNYDDDEDDDDELIIQGVSPAQVVFSDCNYQLNLLPRDRLTSSKSPRRSYLALVRTPSRKSFGFVQEMSFIPRKNKLLPSSKIISASPTPQPHTIPKNKQAFRRNGCSKSNILRHDQPPVTELSPEDSSRCVVEMIFRSNWKNDDDDLPNAPEIDRILKVHNPSSSLSKFEAYRECVKDSCSLTQNFHPRCMADGNELLRFHTATIACSLGAQTSSCLCILPTCQICSILRSGFPTPPTHGIHTTAKISENLHAGDDDQLAKAKAAAGKQQHGMLVCRVIAGRIYTATSGDQLQDLVSPPCGYDSIAAPESTSSCCQHNANDLFVYNTQALLPCFFVVYKC